MSPVTWAADSAFIVTLNIVKTRVHGDQRAEPGRPARERGDSRLAASAVNTVMGSSAVRLAGKAGRMALERSVGTHDCWLRSRVILLVGLGTVWIEGVVAPDIDVFESLLGRGECTSLATYMGAGEGCFRYPPSWAEPNSPRERGPR